MLRPKAILTGAAALVMAGGVSVAAPAGSIVAVADMIDSAGSAAGRATLRQSGDRVVMQLKVTGLSPGTHGLHLHTAGNCEGPKFTSAGGHLNPFGKLHGAMNPAGSHLGDLPNLIVKANRSGEAIAIVSLAANDALPLILDNDGTALVVHATADDYRTDPSGNSGDRIACGVFKRVA